MHEPRRLVWGCVAVFWWACRFSLAVVDGPGRGSGGLCSYSLPQSSVHFVGFACRTFVLPPLRLRLHARFGNGITPWTPIPWLLFAHRFPHSLLSWRSRYSRRLARHEYARPIEPQ